MMDVNQFLNTLLLDPEFSDYMDAFKSYLKIEFNCHAIGIVEDFYPDQQFVDVSLVYTKTEYVVENGVQVAKYVPYPILTSVPIIVLGGGISYMSFPITRGDQCLLLFNDRDIDNWFLGSTNSPPNSSRLHSFADAIAIVGIRNKSNAIASYDLNRVVLAYGTTMVRVGADKVGILNATTTLNTVLQNLSTQLENLTTELQTLTANIALLTVICAAPGNPSSVPVNAAAFVASGVNIAAIQANITTIASQMGGLLE